VTTPGRAANPIAKNCDEQDIGGGPATIGNKE
jgi:hypothetical protein